jgi:hypothetical protein
VCLCAICAVLVRKTCNKEGENRIRVDKTAMRSFTVFILQHKLRLSNGTRVAGHVTGTGEGLQILIISSEEKRLLWRAKHGWKGNIKIDTRIRF